MKSKLFSFNMKKITAFIFLFYLAQASSLLWSWHVYTDTNHHPESDPQQNSDPQKEGNSNCPICNQLKTLGAESEDPEPGFLWTDVTCEEIFTPQFVCISELNKWPHLGRSPPAC